MTSMFFRHLIFWLVALLMVAEARGDEGHEFERSRISMKLKRKASWSMGLGSFTNSKRDGDGGYRNYYGGSLTRQMELSPYREVRTSITFGSTIESQNSFFGVFTVGGAFLLPRQSITHYLGAELGGGLEALTDGVFAGKLVLGSRFQTKGIQALDVGLNYIAWSHGEPGLIGFQAGVTF